MKWQRVCQVLRHYQKHLLHLKHHLSHLVFKQLLVLLLLVLKKLLHVVSLLLEFLFEEIVSLLEKIIEVTSILLPCIVQQGARLRFNLLRCLRHRWCSVAWLRFFTIVGSLGAEGVWVVRGYTAEAGDE